MSSCFPLIRDWRLAAKTVNRDEISAFLFRGAEKEEYFRGTSDTQNAKGSKRTNFAEN